MEQDEDIEIGTSDDVPPSAADEGVEPTEQSDDSQTGGQDASEDDAAHYSQRVKKRIGELSFRAKKAEYRAENAERRAAAVEAQLAAMRAEVDKIGADSAAAKSQAAEGSLQAKIDDAKARYRRAREELDVDMEMQAQEELDTLRAELREARRRPPEQPRQQESQQQPPRNGARAEDFPKATQDWMAGNAWFSSGQYPRMSQVAAEIAGQMAEEGFDAGDPKTFVEMNRRIKEEIGPKYAALVKDPEVGRPRGNGAPPVGGGTQGAGSGKAKPGSLTEADKATMRRYGLDPTQASDRKAWLQRHDQL